ncbi:hypothetical protein D3C80_2155210 [compost metagenome]
MGRWGAQKGVRNGLWVMKWNLGGAFEDDEEKTSEETTNHNLSDNESSDEDISE